MTTAEAVSQLQSIPLRNILPSPYQTRKTFDQEKLKELAQTLKDHGLLNAIVVRQVGGRFELVSGERRVRAAKLLGWDRIEAKIESIGDREAAEQVVVENLQREDLNPIEQAEGYRKLEDMGLTQKEIAAKVGKDQGTVARYLALLELPQEIQEIMPRGIISERHARAISKLQDPKDQIKLALQADRVGWSVKETERQVLDLLEKTYIGASYIGARPPSKGTPAQFIASEGFNFAEQGKFVEIRARWDRTTDMEGFIAELRGALILWASAHPLAVNSDQLSADSLPDGIDPELIRLAQQGPPALYAKLYGPKHKLTQLVAHDTWADMHVTWQEGLKTLLKERQKPSE